MNFKITFISNQGLDQKHLERLGGKNSRSFFAVTFPALQSAHVCSLFVLGLRGHLRVACVPALLVHWSSLSFHTLPLHLTLRVDVTFPISFTHPSAFSVQTRRGCPKQVHLLIWSVQYSVFMLTWRYRVLHSEAKWCGAITFPFPGKFLFSMKFLWVLFGFCWLDFLRICHWNWIPKSLVV